MRILAMVLTFLMIHLDRVFIIDSTWMMSIKQRWLTPLLIVNSNAGSPTQYVNPTLFVISCKVFGRLHICNVAITKWCFMEITIIHDNITSKLLTRKIRRVLTNQWTYPSSMTILVHKKLPLWHKIPHDTKYPKYTQIPCNFALDQSEHSNMKCLTPTLLRTILQVDSTKGGGGSLHRPKSYVFERGCYDWLGIKISKTHRNHQGQVAYSILIILIMEGNVQFYLNQVQFSELVCF